MDDIQVIVFSQNFTEMLKVLKSFIENYFLESHKTIKLKINGDNSIRCIVNMGRYIIHFTEYPEKCTVETNKVFNLPIELLKNYTEESVDKKLELLIKPENSIFVRSSKFLFPIKETEAPEDIDLPFVEEKSADEETFQTFKSLFEKCYQKENLITVKNNFFCEKLSTDLFHIEPFEFDDISFSFKDLKLIKMLSEIEGNTLSFTVAPRYNVFTTKDKVFYTMKYKIEPPDKEVFGRRIHLSKDKIINIVSISYEDLKKVFNALNIAGNKDFGLTVGETCYLSSKNTEGYKLDTILKQVQVVQRFILNKKEISVLLKSFAKEERITVVTSKDFVLFGNRLLLMMRSLYNES